MNSSSFITEAANFTFYSIVKMKVWFEKTKIKAWKKTKEYKDKALPSVAEVNSY